ncbi:MULTISPECIES: SDR family NAD(P)-dependent oxidoreductase [Mycobacteriales]|uniref:SDR family NAD(P)-dependent oxidoreductase n=1 Tax=Mycobacteriales TaxID=85007 RepID=UPI000BDEDC5F|nr:MULTISPECIES: SDR family oxidoreductase [Mycobacteriales]MCY1657873.1 SDR family oxidoreductase [Dietzia sp. SL131]
MTTTSTTMIPARAAARLSGKVAVVTGAGQGVGRGIALALAESGAAVVLLAEPMPLDEYSDAAFRTAKEAIRSLPRAAACERGPDGIRALAVAPHAHSPGLDWWMRHNPEEAERFIARIPAGRVGDPVADIGRPVAWLCTAEASYLTGVTIPLDGGQSRWG